MFRNILSNLVSRCVQTNRSRRRRFRTAITTSPAEILESRRLLTAIGNGQELLATHGVGASQSFEFTATAGDTIRVSVGETVTASSFEAEPYLELFSPTGESLGTDWHTGGNNAELQRTAAIGGTYRAVVSDLSNDEELSFRIRAAAIPGTSSPQLIANRDQVLASGEEITSSIPLGTFNLYQFTATAGDTIRVSVGETATANNFEAEPYLELISPTGESLGADWHTGGDNAELQRTAAIDGTYTAIVRDLSNDNELSFRIRAAAIPGTSSPQLIANRDQVLASGEEITSSIPLGTFNLYQFTATAGDTIRVSVGETGTANNFEAEPYLELISPTGESLGADWHTGGDNAELQRTAAIDGTYTAIVRDLSNDNELSFRIRAAAIPGTSSPQLIANRDQVLASGEEITSSIPLGTFNLYQFTATAGDTIRVSVGETATANNFEAEPYLELISPTGESLGADWHTGGDNAELQRTAAIDGTYTAIVRDLSNDEELSFRIRAAAIPGTSSPQLIANRDQVLASGEEITSSVPLGTFNLYQFTATAGDTIRVSVGETAVANNFEAEPYLELISPTGESLGADWHTGGDNAELQRTAAIDGTYTAIVRDLSNDNELSFRIRAATIPGTSSPQLIANRDQVLASGEEITSSIPLGTFNLYQFTATAGDTIRVSVGETATANNFEAEPYLELISPTGESLGADWRTSGDNAELQRTAAIDGTYTAIVRDLSNDEELSFRIRAAAIPGTSSPQLIANRDQVLASGEEITSSIPLGTFNLYQFTAAAGDTIRVSVGETGTANNFEAEPYLELISPTGESLGADWHTGGDNAELQRTAEFDGTYTAIVRDLSNDEELSFRVSLDIQGSTIPIFTSPTTSTRTQDGRLPVEWTPVSGADRYELWYTRVATGESGYINEFTSATSFTPSANLPIGRYWVWVRVSNVGGSTSAWSDAINIHVNTAPVIQPPEFHQATTRPTLQWNTVSGAEQYDLWVNNVTTGQSQVIRKTDLTETGYSAVADLGFGLHTTWVRGVDASGQAGAWSVAERFYIGPQPLNAAVSTFDTTPTFEWTTQSGNVTYEVYVRDANGTVIRESGLPDGNWTPSSDLPAGRTVWWVRPTLNGNRLGQWSQRQEIFVGGRTNVIAPTGVTNQTSPVFQWASVAGAGSYEVYVQRLSDNSVTRQTVVAQTTAVFPASFSAGEYRVWVLSISVGGNRGFWSLPSTFTIV